MGVSYNNNLLVSELIVGEECKMTVDNLGLFYLTLAILALAIAIAAFAVLRKPNSKK